ASSRCPVWVKSGKAHTEQMLSSFTPLATFERRRGRSALCQTAALSTASLSPQLLSQHRLPIWALVCRGPQRCISQAAPKIDPSLRRAVSVAVVPVSAFNRNSATSPLEGAASEAYRADTSSAPSTRFQILTRETPPWKKLLRSRVPRRTGDAPEAGLISS